MRLDRAAAWLSFAAAVLGQCAILAIVYFVTDDASPNALRNAGGAGGVALAALAVMVMARRAGKARASALEVSRLPLRLVGETASPDAGQRRRSAA